MLKSSQNIIDNKADSSNEKYSDIHENITCFLCKNYLIDAVTLTECLHFC